ncbi:MAG: hypothetical protein ABI995_02940 [Acidobacteriota bacterium]
MAVDFDRHNGAFQRAFGQPATYTHYAGGDPLELELIPTRDQTDYAREPGTLVTFWARRSDFSIDPSEGDQVQTGGKTYTVFSVRDDNGGGLILSLNELS